MAITLTSSVLTLMLDEARKAHPLECCGLLLGSTPRRIEMALPARNVAPDPRRHFEIDAQTLIDAHRQERQGGPLLLGYYHSHPSGLAQPSSTDQAQASRGGRLWAIIAGDDMTLWQDHAAGFQRVPYHVVPA